ncbi:MAG TPA: hypothetical protein VMV43_06825 [Candidatus Nanopelagicaceae bacterium]|nr:hypothetical protein [Candidatus Nanopelagicaceae bacterium]
MAILELGINLGIRNILNKKYYDSDTGVGLDPELRAGFLSALESFTSEVFGDDINVISLASFKLVCYCDLVALPNDETNKQPLISFAITEKKTESEVVKKHLKEINSRFLNRYSLNDIFTKKEKFFKEFEERVDNIIGDLRLKTEDRFRSIF